MDIARGPVKVLIVEDDPEIRDIVSLCFEINWPECQVVLAGDGCSALESFGRDVPDLVVLDLGLPDIDGLEVCAAIREQSRVPIIILTARDREPDIVRGLTTGADDYITKPFSQIQFLARVQALLRRTLPAEPLNVFVDGKLRVDFDRREMTLAGEVVRLTPTEYKLLEQLLRNADRVVLHSELLENVWGAEYRDATSYLKSHIRALREKLGDSASSRLAIVTERSIGYRYVTSSFQ